MEDREGSSRVEDPVGSSGVGGREMEDREESSRVEEDPVGSSGVGGREMEDREESFREEDLDRSSGEGEMEDR